MEGSNVGRAKCEIGSYKWELVVSFQIQNKFEGPFEARALIRT
jgi:hypothetical protein